jgi:protein SCO1/2
MRPRCRSFAVLLAAALALVAAAGCAGGTSGAGHSAAPSSSDQASSTGFDGALLPGGTTAPGFILTDQDRRRVSLSGLQGRVAILAFLSCASGTTAPLIADPWRAGQWNQSPHSRRVPALAVSVDPAGDTPACVRAFLRRTSLTGRLEYLTGAPARLRAVWRAYGVVPASAGEGAYERAAFVLLLDRTGTRRVEFGLEQLTPEGLAHDIRKLQRESAAARSPRAPDILPAR